MIKWVRTSRLYLELISTFKNLLNVKKDEVGQQKGVASLYN